ncbi:MAG: type II toxin-antitoxin system RelE/ParE family toxin [Clostridiales Family XIII bacterium]|jgi:toxin ParE1/3/4|nr:type II toxin-antitoxin system RelE/ParE family toxin [Clostridiales Family XIII bacterium]
MTYDVKIAEQALRDLKMVYEYIANVLMEPVIAEKQYSRIEKAAYSLEYMPERFRRYEKEPWRKRNLRVMPVDNYIVFYIADNEKQSVTVIRIMYGRRNTEEKLNQRLAQSEFSNSP